MAYSESVDLGSQAGDRRFPERTLERDFRAAWEQLVRRNPGLAVRLEPFDDESDRTILDVAFHGARWWSEQRVFDSRYVNGRRNELIDHLCKRVLSAAARGGEYVPSMLVSANGQAGGFSPRQSEFDSRREHRTRSAVG